MITVTEYNSLQRFLHPSLGLLQDTGTDDVSVITFM
jgi:hypothetical protein